MIPIKIISTQDENLLQVRFFPTDICNFNCSYCWPGTHDGNFRYPKDLGSILENFKNVFVHFFDSQEQKYVQIHPTYILSYRTIHSSYYSTYFGCACGGTDHHSPVKYKCVFTL